MPWIVSLATVAEDEAAIHHRPTVSRWQTKPAESIKPLFKPLFSALTPRHNHFSVFSYSNSIPFSFLPPFTLLFSLHLSLFSRVTSFICVWLLLLSVLSQSALLLGPRWTCWYTVELRALTWAWIKREEHFRKKRPRPKDYRRPFSLLVQHYLHQTNAYLIFFFFFQGGWVIQALKVWTLDK